MYGGPQLSRQKLIPHGKRKLLTVKENYPRQKEKDSRQKEKDSRQKEKPRGKKKKTRGKNKRLMEKRKTDSRQKKKGNGGWPSFSKYSMGKKSS